MTSRSFRVSWSHQHEDKTGTEGWLTNTGDIAKRRYNVLEPEEGTWRPGIHTSPSVWEEIVSVIISFLDRAKGVLRDIWLVFNLKV
jgi:hypothetical protein